MNNYLLSFLMETTTQVVVCLPIKRWQLQNFYRDISSTKMLFTWIMQVVKK